MVGGVLVFKWTCRKGGKGCVREAEWVERV